MKAIQITSTNRVELATRWNVEEADYDEVLPLGYWLVTDFGVNTIEDMPFETLTEAKFTTYFTIIAPIGETAWKEIVRN
jgi:hypothetical protein